MLPDLTYFTPKYYLKTQFQRPYGRASSFSAAFGLYLCLEGPEGFLMLLWSQRPHKKESVKIRLWQHWLESYFTPKSSIMGGRPVRGDKNGEKY